MKVQAEKLEFRGTTRVEIDGRKVQVKVFVDVDGNRFVVRDFDDADVPMVEIYKVDRGE